MILKIIIIIIIVVILVIMFTHGNDSYIPEPNNNAPAVHGSAAVLQSQSTLHVMLFHP
jgi:uncharacterized membrane protein YqiK